MPIIGASYSPFLFRLFYRFVFRFWGFGVFSLFFRLFFNYLSQESSIIVAGADPVMSSEARGGLR
jgi:hypothetical protein